MKVLRSFAFALFTLLPSTSAKTNTPSLVSLGGAAKHQTQQQQWKPKIDFPAPPNTTAIVKLPTKENKKAAIVMGLILAFNSGFINGLCLSGVAAANGAKQAVSAVTASWTNSAMGLASGNMGQFKFLSAVILSFMGGSVIAGFLNPKPPKQFTLQEESNNPSPLPWYSTSFYIGAVLLALAGMNLGKGDNNVKLGFLLASMANGIQNSITSVITGNLCRTSHYTGITSDMGTFLGQCLRGNKTNLFKLQVFAGLAAVFWMGGFSSYFAASELQNSALYISAALYILIGTFYK